MRMIIFVVSFLMSFSMFAFSEEINPELKIFRKIEHIVSLSKEKKNVDRDINELMVLMNEEHDNVLNHIVMINWALDRGDIKCGSLTTNLLSYFNANDFYKQYDLKFVCEDGVFSDGIFKHIQIKQSQQPNP